MSQINGFLYTAQRKWRKHKRRKKSNPDPKHIPNPNPNPDPIPHPKPNPKRLFSPLRHLRCTEYR